MAKRSMPKQTRARVRTAASRALPDTADRPTLIAYRLYDSPIKVEPAPITRTWMDETKNRFAYHCLPLLVANQSGWIVTGCPALVATWNGGEQPDDLVIESDADEEDHGAVSHFGHGIVTWRIPLIFRTSPGYNLLVRGVPNLWKEGAIALEGLVETDWSVMTFTVNWRITRADHPVRFGPEDPLCLIVPQRRGELERFQTRVGPITADDDLHQAYQAWAKDRRQYMSGPRRPEWQGFYMRGTSPTGHSAREHQTKLRLETFVEDATTTSLPERGQS